MGILFSGDLFNQTTDRILEGMSNIVKEVDDVLLFSDTIKGVAENLKEMLTRFAANNVTLAPIKLKFGQEVKFAGMRITKDCCAPGAISKTRDKITSETACGFVPAVLQVGAGHGSSLVSPSRTGSKRS